MKLSSIMPGQTVYDVGTYRMGNTMMRSVGVWHVNIISVDREAATVLASWNGNRERIFREREFRRWRKKYPVLVSTGFCGQQRLATKAELAAAKHP